MKRNAQNAGSEKLILRSKELLERSSLLIDRMRDTLAKLEASEKAHSIIMERMRISSELGRSNLRNKKS